jgi:hypothetical protein
MLSSDAGGVGDHLAVARAVFTRWPERVEGDQIFCAG